MTANEEISKMVIKQDCQEIFELDIIIRKSFQNNLFEFNIEEYITVEQFREITSVDFEDLEKTIQFFYNLKLSTREFIRENSIFQMNVLQTENSKGSMMFGLQMLDQMKSRVMNPEDDDRFSTIIVYSCYLNFIIGLNSNQGDHICGLPEEEQDTTKTLLFFFSRHTPKISQYLSDFDFTIIMFQQQIKPSSSLPNIKQENNNYFESSSDFQNLPQQQSFDLQSLDESGLKSACQEAQKVNQDLKVYVEDLMRKQSDGEKILYDRERTIRDQKSKNTYLEQENRRLRARAKELEESFAASESRNKDMDKDKEQTELQLKIMSKKFEVEKQKADPMSSKINEKELEIARCKDILNQANKYNRTLTVKPVSHKLQMKLKDADYSQLKERLEKTESLFKEAARNSKAIGQIEQQKITQLIMQAVGTTSGDFIPTQKANNQVIVENQNQEMMMQVDSQEKDQPHASNQDLDEDEGEILDEEPDMAKVQKFKLQMKAKQLLKQSNCTEDKSLNPETNLGQSSLLSTFNNKDFEDSKISKPQNFKYSSLFEQSNIKAIDDSKVTPASNNMISTPQTAITKLQFPNSSATLDSSSIPDEMLCVGCMDKRKEVMIVSCRHLVYCKPCEDHNNLRHADYKECPICRKEYKKTLQIFYT